LASGFTFSNDEVFIEIDEHLFLKNMSKNPGQLFKKYAELVGISKISRETYRNMCVYAERIFQENTKLDYEYALVGVAKENKIFVKKIEDLAWCEIDDAEHLTRAIESVYPLIQRKESHGGN
jgi:2-aminoethylphosphonate-pyruvate transaminase